MYVYTFTDKLYRGKYIPATVILCGNQQNTFLKYVHDILQQTEFRYKVLRNIVWKWLKAITNIQK